MGLYGIVIGIIGDMNYGNSLANQSSSVQQQTLNETTTFDSSNWFCYAF